MRKKTMMNSDGQCMVSVAYLAARLDYREAFRLSSCPWREGLISMPTVRAIDEDGEPFEAPNCAACPLYRMFAALKDGKPRFALVQGGRA